MLEFENKTAATAKLYYSQAFDQRYYYIVVHKQCYRFNQFGDLVCTEAVIQEQDSYRGESCASSLLHATDVFPYKKNPEILLSGSVPLQKYEQTGKKIKMSVVYTSGDMWQKSLLIYGRRYWGRRYGYKKTVFDNAGLNIDLCYEHTFGGQDTLGIEARNPVGLGFLSRPTCYWDRPLPLIEYPDDRVLRPYQRVRPASFLPIASHWQPRLTFLKKCASLLDFSNAYQVAAADQQLLRAELPKLIHLTKFHLFSPKIADLNLALPTQNVEVGFQSEHHQEKIPLSFDTIIIDIDRYLLQIVSRLCLPVNRQDMVGSLVLRERR